MTAIHGVEVGAAFAAGVVSFLSPCVLPLVPAYVSYIAGLSLDDLERGSAGKALGPAVMFVLGFSTVFVLLGAGATAAGEFLVRHSLLLLDIAGVIVIVFGLAMMGVVRVPVLQRDLRFHPAVARGRRGGAWVLGAAFGFGWTPCIGPILGSVLAVAAVNSTVSGGIVLLAVYALGLGLPFLAAALFTGFFLRHRRGLGRFGHHLQRLSGAVLVLMGVAMLTGWLARAAWWLLETFPGLGAIG